MEQLREQLAKLKSQFYQLLERIEGSTLFERAVFKYESLEPRQQEWMRFLGKVSLLGCICFFILQPLFSAYSKRSDLDGLYELNSAVKQFNMELAQKKQGYIAPQGWERFEINDASTFQEALSNYFAQIGISEDFYDIQTQGNSLNIKITELSVRQLTALSFQVDGFFPVAYFSQFQTSVHPSNKELLQFDGVVEFKSELAAQLPQGGVRNGQQGSGGYSPPNRSARQQTPPPELDDSQDEEAPTSNPRNPNRPSRVERPRLSPNHDSGQDSANPPAPNEPPEFGNDIPPLPADLEPPPGFPGPDDDDEFLPPELAPPPEFSEEE